MLLVHDTQGHGRMEFMASLQDGLRDHGINSLAITLGLGIDKRRGMFDCGLEQDHRHEDAIDEIAAWVRWLKDKGAQAVTVAGHGRGANQAALYAINKLDKAVKRIVLIAPLMQTAEKTEAEYRARFGRPLRPELAKAEELVAVEQGNQLVDVAGFLNCQHAQVTAGALPIITAQMRSSRPRTSCKASRFRSCWRSGTPTRAWARSRRPRLSSPRSYKTVSFAVIPGADQDFRDAGADELAKKIKEFIGHRLQG